jgi:hypothetical protein
MIEKKIAKNGAILSVLWLLLYSQRENSFVRRWGRMIFNVIRKRSLFGCKKYFMIFRMRRADLNFGAIGFEIHGNFLEISL